MIYSQKLISNSLAVATVSGTAGWEALFQSKPTLLFGSIYYQYAPGVTKIRTNEDCKKAIELAYVGKLNPRKDDLCSFLNHFYNCSIHGWSDAAYEKVANINYEQNLTNLTNAIIELIS